MSGVFKRQVLGLPRLPLPEAHQLAVDGLRQEDPVLGQNHSFLSPPSLLGATFSPALGSSWAFRATCLYRKTISNFGFLLPLFFCSKCSMPQMIV